MLSLTSRTADEADRAGAAFVAARYLENAHVQTFWAALGRPHPRVQVVPEAWTTPDGDVLDLDFLPARPGAPGVLVLHGLEGSSRAKYVRGTLRAAQARGWNGAALNFRGCGPSSPRTPRSYHSGETSDLAFVVERLRERWKDLPLGLVGFSLGGNVLLKWLGEQGDAAPIRAGVAVSPPCDLTRTAAAMDGPGFWRLLYRLHFLPSLQRKAMRLARLWPGRLDALAIPSARTFRAYDGLVTAPMFGFDGVEDYWSRASSGPYVPRIRRPALILAAEDDPIVPTAALPRDLVAANPCLRLHLTRLGGHVGFVEGSLLNPLYAAERIALEFLRPHLAGDGEAK
ncbi:MAG: alpha/beta fold hydrolase [Planctomycetes bacterium]|nr:alpha/beta fold hydrolase [Planctomycetota bacterium]